MFKVNNTEAKISSAKRNITISGVSIVDGKLVDESGDIVENLFDALPDPTQPFTIKISIKLDDDDINYEEE